MWNIVGVEYCKCKCDSDSIITAKGRAFCADNAVFQLEFQTVGIHIDRAVLFFHSNHVNMSLQHDRGGSFIAGCSRLKDNDIVGSIFDIFQFMCFGKCSQIITDRIGMTGAMWDGADFFKIMKYILWFYR